MIKLPIILAEHDTWQNAVNGAVGTRASLAEAAKSEKAYLRPIVLFQAQPRNEEVTVEALKKYLIEVEQVSEDRIAIATGDQRELDGINLFDPKCPVEHIITVEALKEGWDCSFAYVFCSVQRIQSATDAEQLLGRVLRMPEATRRVDNALNRAYAHVSEPSFGAAAASLADKLVQMGFDEEDAKEVIQPAQGHLDDTGLFGPRERPRPTFTHNVPASQELVVALGKRDRPNVSLTYTQDGAHQISVTGRIDRELEEDIASAIPESERAAFREAVRLYRTETKDRLSPAEQGETFVVPRLVVQVQGEFEFADTDIFMEAHDWTLTSHPAKLEEGEFAIRETARNFEIDVDGNRVTYQYANDSEQLSLDVNVEGWTTQNLVLWLDRQLRQPDVLQSDLIRWLTDCVGYLTGPRKISVAALMRAKFILARKLRDRLAAARAAEREAVYQRCLFSSDAKVEVSLERGFEFRDGMYSDVKRHNTGRFRFSKHYLGPDQVPAFDGVDGGEEFQCAQALDSLPEVKFWIRNVPKHPSSFWLPTASGRFYPDFVAQLNDGRLFVVEYKGALLAGADDTNEKRAVGRLWEAHSNKRGLFLIVERQIDGQDMRAQMAAKLSSD
jgi:type III restriction enzyme